MTQRWPDFFVIGAMKAGTTTLHDYLVGHDQIFMVHPKEPGYFSQPKVYAKGDDWYLSLFKEAGVNQLWGDGSTCYSRWPTFPDVPERIYQRNPQAKFIYVVRDPVKRAYSHYRHRMEEVAVYGGEFKDFAQAIKDDEEMLMAGKYAEQLKRFWKYFPQEQFYIVDFKRLVIEPQAVLKEICLFLNISTAEVLDVEQKVSNQAGEGLAEHKAQSVVKSIRQFPVVKWVFDLLTPDARAKLASTASTVVSKSPWGKRLVKEYVQNIPPASEADLEFLRLYYSSSNNELTQLTGLSTESWESPAVKPAA